MPPKSPPIAQPVVIVELPDFEETADRILNEHSRRACYLLLAEDPLRGTPVDAYPGLLALEMVGFRVLYSVSRGLEKVYLLQISTGSLAPPAPTSEDGKALRKTLDTSIKAGLILGARELLKAIWHLMKEGLS